MTREEYSLLFHKHKLNLVAFKPLVFCDEEVLVLVNAALKDARERDTALLRQAWEALRQCEYTSAPAQRPMVKSAITALQERLGEKK